MKTKNKYQFIIILALAINLSLACSLALAQTNIQTADINISDCTVNCLNLSTPTEISLPNPQFINPDGGYIYIATNTTVGDEIQISDAKGTGGFSLDANITNLSNGTTSIPYTDIGFLTFTATNNANDGRTNPTLTALNNKPYTYNELKTGTDINPADFQYFSGSTFTSDPLIGILQDSPSSTSRGIYNSGFALSIKTPANPELFGLRDDNYILNITFTLYPL